MSKSVQYKPESRCSLETFYCPFCKNVHHWQNICLEMMENQEFDDILVEADKKDNVLEMRELQELKRNISDNDQTTIQDVKYQDITYYKDDGRVAINPQENVPIDFLKAMNEMEKLDWRYEYNFVGFENQKNRSIVQFIRQGKDKWYCEIPIRVNGKWDGYCWAAYSDSKTVTNMLRLFFEEVSWSGMLSWKMRRYHA